MFIGETEKDWSIIAHYQYNKRKKNSSRSTLVYILSFKKSVKKRQKEHDYKNVEGSTSLQVTCISYICRPNSVSNSVKELVFENAET